MVWITIEVHIHRSAQDGSGVQLELWPSTSDLAGGTLPHPPGGTHWQSVLGRYPPGLPLIFGRPAV